MSPQTYDRKTRIIAMILIVAVVVTLSVFSITAILND